MSRYTNWLRLLMVALTAAFALDPVASSQHSAGSKTVPAKPARLVRFVFNCPQCKDGDTVPLDYISTIYFVEPCPLDILHAEIMFRLWTHTSDHQVGCWGQLADGSVSLVDGRGNPTISRASPLLFPRGMVNADGSVTIREPGFTSLKDFVGKQGAKLTSEGLRDLNAHRNEQP